MWQGACGSGNGCAQRPSKQGALHRALLFAISLKQVTSEKPTSQQYDFSRGVEENKDVQCTGYFEHFERVRELDYNPGEEVLRMLVLMLCTEALKEAKTFTAQGIANACSKVDYNPGEEVPRTLCTEALKKAKTFNAQGIANTLNACSKLDYNPGEEVLRTLCAEALNKTNTFNAQDIATT
eukprot:g14048.t1